jgi:hypothetical protein
VSKASTSTASCSPQRVSLRSRETLEAIQHSCQQLMQCGEGELHLRLDARCTRQATSRRLLDHVFQQCRLAHARLATHHERPALTSANRFDQPIQHVALDAPANEGRRAALDRGASAHLHDIDLTTRTDDPGLASGGCERIAMASTLSAPTATAEEDRS